MEFAGHDVAPETATLDAEHAQIGYDVEPFSDKTQTQMLASLRLLWARRRFLFRSIAWVTVGFALIAFLLPKRYESTARLMPPEQQSSSSLAMLSALVGNSSGASFGADMLGLKSSGALFVGILHSRSVADGLISRFDLRKHYWIRRWDGARRILASKTGIDEDKKSGIISITVSDNDPRLAAALAQAYVEELNRLVVELTTSSAHRERAFLEERLIAIKKELDSAQRDLSQFSSKTGTIDLKEQGLAMVQSAATLQGELIADQSEIEGLRQIYSDSNVRIRMLRARIEELRHQIEKVGGTDSSLGKGPKEEQDSLYPSIRQLPLLGVPYTDLYRRVLIQEAVFETLTKQFELAKVQEAKEIPSVRILDEPLVPEQSSFPPRLAIIWSGLILGFIVSATCVLLMERWLKMDKSDPIKILANDVIGDLRVYGGHVAQRLRLDTSNGVSSHVWVRKNKIRTDYEDK